MDRRIAAVSTLLLIIVNQVSRIDGCCCGSSGTPATSAPCQPSCPQPCPPACPAPSPPPSYAPYPPPTSSITDILLQLVSGLKSPSYSSPVSIMPVPPVQTLLPPTVVAPGYCCAPCCCKPDTATIPINLEVVPSIDCSKSSRACVLKDPSCRSCCSCCC